MIRHRRQIDTATLRYVAITLQAFREGGAYGALSDSLNSGFILALKVKLGLNVAPRH